MTPAPQVAQRPGRLAYLARWVHAWHPGQLVVFLALVVSAGWMLTRQVAELQGSYYTNGEVYPLTSRSEWADSVLATADPEAVKARDPLAPYVTFEDPRFGTWSLRALSDSAPEWRARVQGAWEHNDAVRRRENLISGGRYIVGAVALAVLWVWFGGRRRPVAGAEHGG